MYGARGPNGELAFDPAKGVLAENLPLIGESRILNGKVRNCIVFPEDRYVGTRVLMAKWWWKWIEERAARYQKMSAQQTHFHIWCHLHDRREEPIGDPPGRSRYSIRVSPYQWVLSRSTAFRRFRQMQTIIRILRIRDGVLTNKSDARLLRQRVR